MGDSSAVRSSVSRLSTGIWRRPASVFLPRAEEQSIGGFGFQAWEFEDFDLEGAVRWDRRVITPAAPDTNKAGIIRTRDFDGFSGSVAGRWHLDQSNRVRAIVSRTFQSPAIEELFSEGPHLAAYSYEVGNAALDAERSWGGELEYQIETGGVSLTAAAFYYDIDGYIFAADTGELEYGPATRRATCRSTSTRDSTPDCWEPR